MRRVLPLLGATLVLACSETPLAPLNRSAPAPAPAPTAPSRALSVVDVFQRYVSLGTSNSMGVQSAGVFAVAQRAAWPAQLARRAGAAFALPLVEDPGCGPPLLPPLAADMVLVGAFGGDLVTAAMTLCMPLRSGITLPTDNVAISGANVHDALAMTPELAASHSARVGALYSRVLPPGHTQLTAALAKPFTFFSVELAANEVLPASTGRVSAMTPFTDWERDYDEIVGRLADTGARGVLVGLLNDAATFPSIRRARELWAEWPYLYTLGIRVSSSCYWSANHIFVPGYILSALSRAPTTVNCGDVAGATDYVLTPADMYAINALMARMNAHIQALASEYGLAYFSLDAVYGLPKPRFSVMNLLFSDTPFGANMSLDGVHPSTQGQAILAAAAVQAINSRYGLTIP